MAYSDFEYVVAPISFTGGSGATTLPNPNLDSRATIEADLNGVYQVNYYPLAGISDLDSLGYYDTDNNNINGNPNHWDEIDQFPSGDPAVSNAYQLLALYNLLNQGGYGSGFSDVANIEFNLGNVFNSQIILMSSTTGGLLADPGDHAITAIYANTGFINEELSHGDLILNADSTQIWDAADKGSAGYFTIMHELGHALGLEHTGTDNPNYDADLDSMKYSVMSYNFLDGMEPPSTPDDEIAPFGLQLLDIAAIQEIYGRNYETRNAETFYNATGAFASDRPNDAFIYTIWDGGGIDEIDASSYFNPDGSFIDLRQGKFSSIGFNATGGSAVDNVAIAYYTIIENAIGTAHGDILVGNAWDNRLDGGSGDDLLFGDGVANGDGVGELLWESDSGDRYAIDGSGNDFLVGNSGWDDLYGGAGWDMADYSTDPDGVTATSTGPGDWSVTDGYGDIDSLYSVENLMLTGYDDTVTVSMLGISPFGRFLGGDGTDSFVAVLGTYDPVSQIVTNLQGTTAYQLENFENVNVQHVLPDYDLETLGTPSYVDFSGASTSADFHLWRGSGGNTQGDQGITIGASEFTYNLPPLSASGVQVVHGTNLGDTFTDYYNLREVGTSTPRENARVAFILGYGDDEVDFADAGGDDTIFVYTGGNDKFISGPSGTFITSDIDTIVLSNTVAADVSYTIDEVISGPVSNHSLINWTLNIAGKGSIQFENFVIENASGVAWNDPLDRIYVDGGTLRITQTAGAMTGLTFVSGANPYTNLDLLTNGNDNLAGTSGNDTITAMLGSDFIDAQDGDDNIYASGGDDVIIGGAGDDNIHGGIGNDVLAGDAGEDDLYAGSGADNFTFSNDDLSSAPDHVRDFSLFEEDKIDLHDVLSAYNPNTDDLADFVQITTDGTDSFLAVDTNGGGDNFQQIATLYGVSGLADVEDLVLSGALIVEGTMAQGLLASHYLVNGGTSALTEINFSATPWHTETVASIDQPNTSSTPFYTGGPTDLFAVSYEGYLNVVTAGAYTFDLTSDDGSALWLDGELLIGNDGLHSQQTVSESITLTAGLHALEVHYLEESGNQIVQLQWSGADTGNVMETIDGASLVNDGVGVNVKPDAADDVILTSVDTPVNISVLLNDHDPDGDDVEITAVTQGSNGSVTINTNGTLTYTPDTSYAGQDSFTYTLSDGNGGTSIAEVEVTIQNDVGLFASHFLTTGSESSLSQIDFSATPYHTETVASINQPNTALTPFYAGGPTDNFAVSYEGYINVVTAGTYTFDLISDDGSAMWLDGEILIDNDGLHGQQTQSETVTLTAGLHALEVHYFEASGNQVLQLKWNGPDTGNVLEIIDSASLVSYGEGVNIKPVAVNDAAITASNAPVNISVLTNDNDEDGDDLDVTAVTQGSNGSVTINLNGTVTYTPNTNYTGSDSFTYTANDGNGGTSIASVDIAIAAGALSGTSGNDTINGGSGNDTISGLGGNDTIIGNAGQDDLSGGQGNDTYVFAAGFGAATTLGPDVVEEEIGEGTDIIDLSTVAFDDVSMWVDANDDLHIRLKSDADDELVIVGGSLVGGGTDVTSRVESVVFSDHTQNISDALFLRDSDDGHTIHGSAGGDLIVANGGNDVIYGFGGNDFLQGGDGTDTAYGGSGNDRYTGLGEGDVFYGEDGADWIEFLASNPLVSGGDTFADFDISEDDWLDIRNVLSGYDPLTEAITDFVQISTSGSDSLLSIDSDGGGNSFVQIATLIGVTGLTDEAALVTSGTLIIS